MRNVASVGKKLYKRWQIGLDLAVELLMGEPHGVPQSVTETRSWHRLSEGGGINLPKTRMERWWRNVPRGTRCSERGQNPVRPPRASLVAKLDRSHCVGAKTGAEGSRRARMNGGVCGRGLGSTQGPLNQSPRPFPLPLARAKSTAARVVSNTAPARGI